VHHTAVTWQISQLTNQHRCHLAWRQRVACRMCTKQHVLLRCLKEEFTAAKCSTAPHTRLRIAEHTNSNVVCYASTTNVCSLLFLHIHTMLAAVHADT
jgi:hypothetical protein